MQHATLLAAKNNWRDADIISADRLLQLILVDVFLAPKNSEANALILGAHEVRFRLRELAAQIADGLGGRVRVQICPMDTAKHGTKLSVKTDGGHHISSTLNSFTAW